MARLATGFWVQAYLQRLGLENIPAYITARGDDTAGAVIVKLVTLDGNARAFRRMMQVDGDRPWEVFAEGLEPDVDASLARQRSFDPDLWLIEVESREGRHLLDTPGLD